MFDLERVNRASRKLSLALIIQSVIPPPFSIIGILLQSAFQGSERPKHATRYLTNLSYFELKYQPLDAITFHPKAIGKKYFLYDPT